MIKYVLLIIFIVVSEVLTYKYIKMIDKKQRKKLYDWELGYIEEISQLKKQLAEKKGKKENDGVSNNSFNSNQNVLESTSSREDNM